MPAPAFLAGLPKPILFGLYGALGGLVGAVLFGEPAWQILEPPKAPPSKKVAVGASSSVKLYPKTVNSLVVKIARSGIDGPVAISFADAPEGVTLSPGTIDAGQTELSVPVSAAENAPLRKGTVTVTASAQDGTLKATTTFDVEVLPTPPTIAVAAPDKITVYTKGEGKFTATVARRGYDGEIAITVQDLPPGVTALPATIRKGASEVDVTISAKDVTTPLEAKKLTVVATATPEGLKNAGVPDSVASAVRATTSTNLEVIVPPIAPVDVIFVLDVTASMQWALGDLKNSIVKFSDSLTKSNINFRLGLVTFQDIYNEGEKVNVMLFKGADGTEIPFTSDSNAFRDKIGSLKAEGGGDIPESSLEGVEQAVKLFDRQGATGATRMILLITDAPPKVVPEGNTAARVLETAQSIKNKGIDSVNVVADKKLDEATYLPLQNAGTLAGGGKFFDIRDLVRDEGGFDSLMSDFGKDVTAAARSRSDAKPQVAPAPKPPSVGDAAAMSASKAPDAPTIKGVQASGDYAEGTGGQLTLAVGVWSGAIAALVCLALLAGQNLYLRGQYPSVTGALAGFAGGLVVGIVGGAAGQGLYLLSQATFFQVLGWTLLGGLAGTGLSLFIPNLKWYYGLAGGAIGGAVGGMGYLGVSSVAGELVGRLSGGLIVGFFIGLMVALAEAAFRSAWLEVRYGVRETIAVNLGPEPIKVGGDAKLCTVWARGAAPLALRFFLRDGQVICDDATMKRESAVADGYAKEVGNVTVTVRTGSAAVAIAPTGVRPAAPPTPSAGAKAPPPMLEDDFDFAPVAKSPPSPTFPSGGSRPSAPAVSVPPPPVPLPPPPTQPTKPPLPTPAVSKPVLPGPTVPPKPTAPIAPPKPATPPVPSATRPVAPTSGPPKAPASPPATSPPAAGKHPDACPGCGRINAGKPKSRYCMVCDQTY